MKASGSVQRDSFQLVADVSVLKALGIGKDPVAFAFESTKLWGQSRRCARLELLASTRHCTLKHSIRLSLLILHPTSHHARLSQSLPSSLVMELPTEIPELLVE